MFGTRTLPAMARYYITTPIYYVNDRPHIGHCYTTTIADVAARMARLAGRSTFFLTGTDEHAEKVVSSAAAHGMSPLQWSDRNAAAFQAAFGFMNESHDDFIRTTQERHISKVHGYIRRLVEAGDIILGDYTSWWDPSQEEYLTESVARESSFGPYTSPVTGKPLEKRTEKNYLFRLGKYQDRLRTHIESNAHFILPEARRNEVLGRLREPLRDVPISRAVTSDPASQWGIRMPDDPDHRIYVWIDALFNYLSAVDTPDRRAFWPANVHVMAKDILWFHAVIWPALLMALGEPLPKSIYVHSYWVAEGKKMSKSLGNFIDLETLQAYAGRFSLDAVRWYLLTQGPLRETDADFSYSKFVEVYNADLANGIGNCASRVANMIHKYFGGTIPGAEAMTKDGWTSFTPQGQSAFDFRQLAQAAVATTLREHETMRLDVALRQGLDLIGQIDVFINHTRPFSIAKEIDKLGPGPAADQLRGTLGHILLLCAEGVRIASVLLAPAMPSKMSELWRNWNCSPLTDPTNPNSAFKATLAELALFGGQHGLKPGHALGLGEALFMRAKSEDPAPVAERA